MLIPLALSVLLPFAAPEGPTDQEVLAAWEKLDAAQQEEVAEWFRAEVRWLGTFQQGLIDHVLGAQDQDPGLWPIATPAPFYDPATHAPKQPIPRRPLSPTSSALKKKREEFFYRVPERKLDSAWVYDYATRELRRTQRLEDPDRLVRNALRGFPPGLDLAEALVEMELDRGEEQQTLTAFSHAYTDRTGQVFTGLTLYDAWASGSNMEMPDVDILGVYHDLTDDWKSYVAPVPETKHRQLYGKIGRLFEPAHRYRGLRHALAMGYLTGYPALRDGYGHNLERFHALWDDAQSEPATLAEKLPDAKKWESFLEAWVKQVDKSKELQEKGKVRRDTLHNDGLRVRAKLIEVMKAAGALKEE